MKNEADYFEKKQIFVAYSYSLYPKIDYRKIFNEIEGEYDVVFIFADERITNLHILEKIKSYMKSAEFSLFDISGWNPNVTLELGLAMSSSQNWYICINPTNTPMKDVPSDLKGIDRIQYESYTELGQKLRALIEQRFPKRSGTTTIDEYLEHLRIQGLELIEKQPGMRMTDLAKLLDVGVPVAQMAIEPLIGKSIRTEGNTRGRKYFPIA